jgi:glycine/D-amino acid oxidase-like deaminating enzyme
VSNNYDAIILGAGIVGTACALECVLAGLSVAVVERESAGRGGATAAGMGHIVVMDDSPAQFALTRYSQSLWRALAAELPESVEYRQPGTIWVAADDEEMAEARRKFEFFSTQGIRAETLDAEALAEAEPNLSRDVVGGLLMSSDAVLYPPAAAQYLLQKARLQKAELTLFEGQAAVAAGRGEVTLQDGTELCSPRIVNATGALAPALTPGVAVRKRKGHLTITKSYPGFVRHQVVELGYLKSAHSIASDSVAFNVQPRRNGQLVIGSSRQYGSEDPAVEPEIVVTMMERAVLFMPGLAALATERVWCGFRAATPDKLPLIGPTEDSTVFLATGHEGLGITTSLATARLLVDHFMGRESAISIEPYLPSRMAK